MKSILKGEKNYFLFILFLILMLILWGRIVVNEIIKESYTKNLITRSDRIRCVESFGWKVDPQSELCENFRLPKNFDNTYTKYNELIKQSGFDLTLYKGKVIKKYSYIITNPPQNAKGTFYATLLTYENSMIGGDVYTPEINGMMMPIKRD